jgi:hypothetical protein
MAGTYGEPGKNTFAVPGISGILSPVVDDTTGITQVYKQGAFNTFQSLGTYNPSTNKFTPDPNAGNLTQNEIKALSSEKGITTIKDSAKTTVSKGVQSAGGTPEAGQAAANKLISPNSANNPDGTGDGSQPVDLKIESSGLSRNKSSSFGKYIYPLDIANTKQDVIKFTMLKYEPRKFQTGQDNLGGFAERTKNRTLLGTVVLPIPSGISESNGVSWGQDTMDPAKALLANIALAGIKGGFGAAADTVGGAVEGVAANSGEVKNAVATKFTEASTGIGGLLARTQGAIFNPNMELLFNAPTLRPFNFTFKMSARSPNEAKQIIQIIRFFKQGMSPQKSISNLYLKSPHTFNINYLYRPKGADADHPYIGAIKECALQSFIVNYTPEGQYATFLDGVMVSYEIQMTFQELEPVFNEDYGNTGSSMPQDLLFRESQSSKP